MSRNARIFETSMYLALVLSAMMWLFPSFFGMRLPSWEYVAAVGAWWAFVIWLVWLTARRAKNWARWVLFALFLTEIGRAFYYGIYWRFGMHVGLYFAGIELLEAMAYYHIFTGDGAAQFRRPPLDSVFS